MRRWHQRISGLRSNSTNQEAGSSGQENVPNPAFNIQEGAGEQHFEMEVDQYDNVLFDANEHELSIPENGDYIDDLQQVSDDADDDFQRITMDENDDFDEIMDYVDSLDERVRVYATTYKLSQRAVNALLLFLIDIGHEGLPKTYQTLFNTPTSKISFKTVAPGQYYHVGLECISKELKKFIDVNAYNSSRVNLRMHIDGISLTSSSTLQAWTILGDIVEFPSLKPFLIGIYVGYAGPKDFDLFLEDLGKDIMIGRTNGFQMTDTTKILYKHKYTVSDAPARSKITHTMGTAGLKGCPYCEQFGTKLMHLATQYKSVIGPLRTDASYRNRCDPLHFHVSHREQNKTGALEDAGVNMISEIVPCAMHTFDLGVMKKIIRFIFEKKGCNLPFSKKFTSQEVEFISNTYEALKKFHPMDFTRKPRSLVVNFKLLKAVECRYILLYYGMIIFKDVMPYPMYQHFLFLSMGARLLAEPNNEGWDMSEMAQQFLEKFVENFTTFYGDQLTYVVHTILHFKQYVELYGPMYSFSAYRYENHLRTIKDFVKKKSDVLLQFRNRISEKGIITRKQETRDGLFGFLKNNRGVKEFSTYIHNSTIFKVDNVNCYGMIRPDVNSIARVIVKIIKFKSFTEELTTFEYQRIESIGPYFKMEELGLSSYDFDIYICGNGENSEINEAPLDSLLLKMISSPIDQHTRLMQKMIHSVDYN